jgi:hypothetical protein
MLIEVPVCPACMKKILALPPRSGPFRALPFLQKCRRCRKLDGIQMVARIERRLRAVRNIRWP